MMKPLVLVFAALTCDPTAAQAKLDQAKHLDVEVADMTHRIAVLTAQIAQLQSYIVEEKANPAGVVDLRRLYELGSDIQSDQAQIAQCKATKTKDEASKKKLLADGLALVKSCKK